MRRIYYSATSRGFYRDDVHASMPHDVVEVTDAEYASLLEGQSAGQVIVPDANGRPVLAAPPPPAEPTPEELLAHTDADMARVVEDIWAALVTKGLVTDADLPHEARDKIAQRQQWRSQLVRSR